MLWTLILTLITSVAQADLWTDDYAAALAKAKAENRFLLLDFTGSDWCGWCKRLDAEVFNKGPFKDYAKENLVCVVLDFPRGSSLKKKVREQNDKLAKEFGITGYPSILVLDPDGKKLTKTGYKDGGAEVYVAHLETIIAPAREKFGKPKAAEATTTPTTPAPGAPAQAGYRTWTAASGSTLEAKLEQRSGNKLYLRTRENKLITIDLASLSADDQAFANGGK